MADHSSVRLQRIIQDFHLKVLTSPETVEKREVVVAEINRPALQLTGFYEYFDPARVQILGKVEFSYLSSLSHEKRIAIFERFFSTNPVCLVLCRSLGEQMDPCVVEIAEKYRVPLLESQDVTTNFGANITQYLQDELAPRICLHGVMVDCFGEGVLIMGESGLGKSETALELVQRGHRLVADDVVEVHKNSEGELMARSVDLIQNMIELRGVGVINVKELYGVQAIRLTKTIDMVVHLEPWSPEKNYDRVGLNTATINILGNEVALYAIPIMVGRNLSMIVETAALNHRQKKMGYNAAEELRDRVNKNIQTRKQQKNDLLSEGGEIK